MLHYIRLIACALWHRWVYSRSTRRWECLDCGRIWNDQETD